MKEIKLCAFTELEEKKPIGKQVNGLDLVIICGHDHVSKFNHNDLSTFDYNKHRLTVSKCFGHSTVWQAFDYNMHRLTGIHYAGGAGH